MFYRTIAALTFLFASSLPIGALSAQPLNRLPDEALAGAAARMMVKDFRGAHDAALKSNDKGVKPFLVGMSAFRLELWEEAATSLAQAAESYPLLADYALYHQAMALCKLKRHDQALQPLYKLLKQYPDSRLARPALLLYGDTLAAAGYYKEALQSYSAFIERYPSGSDALNALLGSALAREQMKDAQAAAGILRGIWLNYPASPVASKAAEELARLRNAGVKTEPYATAELWKRGGILYDLGRNAQAAQAFLDLKLAGESDEFAAKVRLKTGQALFKAKRFSEAQGVLAGLVQKKSGTPGANEANFWLAKCLQRTGKPDEAYQMYLKLAETAKGSGIADDALLEAAYLKRYQRKWAEAQQLFRLFLAKYPDPARNPNVAWEAAWASYQSRDYTGAAAALKKLAGRDELREKALYWQAKALLATGDGKGAESLFTQLAGEYPLGYYALICKRWCDVAQFPALPKSVIGSLPMPAGFEREKALISLGLVDEAARELSRARKPKNPAGLARLYLEMDNYNGALHALEQERLKPADKDLTLWGVNYPLAYSEEVAKNATASQVPESLIYAIMRTESNYAPGALSPVGAVGLMQIMPSTAETISKGASARLTSPELNIRLGAKHIRDLLASYQNVALAAAAYNAGAGNVKKWQQGLAGLPQDEFVESIPFRETREYVKKVVTAMELYQRLYRLPGYKN